MPDYKETNITGRQYQRCSGIFIDNPRGGAQTVSMQEEVVAIVGDKTFSKTAPGLSFAFDPDEIIELRDSETGELTGSTMTGREIYAAIYSIYIQRANARDLAQSGQE